MARPRGNVYPLEQARAVALDELPPEELAERLETVDAAARDARAIGVLLRDRLRRYPAGASLSGDDLEVVQSAVEVLVGKLDEVKAVATGAAERGIV